MIHSDLLRRLLPPVSYDPNGALLSVDLAIEGAALDRSLSRAEALLNEFFPDTCLETLPEWELEYGLPDSCQSVGQSITERRAALVTAVRAGGGISMPAFRQMAIDLGYADAFIDEYRPTTCDDTCDMSLLDDTWRGAWFVRLADATLHITANCGDACEGALDIYKTGPLECMVGRLKPADTTVVFIYGAV